MGSYETSYRQLLTCPAERQPTQVEQHCPEAKVDEARRKKAWHAQWDERLEAMNCNRGAFVGEGKRQSETRDREKSETD